MLRLSGFPPMAIPGPKRLPVVGTAVNVIRLLADPVGHLLELRRRYGLVASLIEGNPGIVCAFGAALNQEVLANGAAYRHDEDFIRAAPGTSLKRLSFALVFLNGDAHKRHRRLMMPAFQKASLDGYAAEIAAVSAGSLDRWPTGATADVSELLRDLALCIAVRCFFGLDVTDGPPELGTMVGEMVEKISTPLSLMLPKAIPGTPYRRAIQLGDRIEVAVRAIIAEKRRRATDGRDALSIMIRAHDEEGSTFTDDELVAQANGLLIAAHETTARTLAWTLFLLERHPRILASLLDEIDGVLGGDPPTPDHLPRLTLLDRVVRESMRLIPAAPTLFVRVCAEEAALGPYRMPQGAAVILSPLVTHREPDVFPEPARFRPERWETIQPSLYEYLPFGAGARMCIGAGFAAMALRIVLPMVLQRHRLTLAPGAVVSRLWRTNILGFKHGLPMRIDRQDRSFPEPGPVRGDIRELVELA